MKNIIKKIFSLGHKKHDVSETQTKQKKKEAILRVGKHYSRAISRLSDT